jgi:hypothetical protein
MNPISESLTKMVMWVCIILSGVAAFELVVAVSEVKMETWMQLVNSPVVNTAAYFLVGLLVVCAGLYGLLVPYFARKHQSEIDRINSGFSEYDE